MEGSYDYAAYTEALHMLVIGDPESAQDYVSRLSDGVLYDLREAAETLASMADDEALFRRHEYVE